MAQRPSLSPGSFSPAGQPWRRHVRVLVHRRGRNGGAPQRRGDCHPRRHRPCRSQACLLARYGQRRVDCGAAALVRPLSHGISSLSPAQQEAEKRGRLEHVSQTQNHAIVPQTPTLFKRMIAVLATPIRCVWGSDGEGEFCIRRPCSALYLPYCRAKAQASRKEMLLRQARVRRGEAAALFFPVEHLGAAKAKRDAVSCATECILLP